MENLGNRSIGHGRGLACFDDRSLKVLKFGGTSVGSVEQLRRVVGIICTTARTHRVVVVTSAAAGVTDTLEEAVQAVAGGTFSREKVAKVLWTRYHILATGLLRPALLRMYELFLQDVLRKQLQPLKLDTLAAKSDRLLALGERLAAPLLACALRDRGLDALPHDAASLIRTDDTHRAALVDGPETYRLIRRWYEHLPVSSVPVVTGFIGATSSGVTTTLGRGGSDYSAALLAAALKAVVLERWTDVDGLYTHDPREHQQAVHMPRLVLEEAWAWNHAGRLGMHRNALDPLVEAQVPVHIRCTAAPGGTGTWVLPAGYEPSAVAVAS
ncbi:MAG: aspartate kinase [Rhodothermales bacterium]